MNAVYKVPQYENETKRTQNIMLETTMTRETTLLWPLKALRFFLYLALWYFIFFGLLDLALHTISP